MHCILNNNTDIYFNLAAEEYLLKQSNDDILMIWRSEPCVVVGKHQNAFAEVNSRFIFNHKIPVARRLTGGGTVYHDLGNINFTFITNGKPGKLVDFKKFVNPVLSFLSTLGINAVIGEKNDILIDGLKISGNAEHVYKNRVLHHGTLLFSSNLDLLRDSLNIIQNKYIDKAVQSNRSSVTNILDYLNEKIDIENFAEKLHQFLSEYFTNSIGYTINEHELIAINQLRDEKYSKWEWIFGYSPAFYLENSIQTEDGIYKFRVYVEKGYITKTIVSDTIVDQAFKKFINTLPGHQFYYEEINNLILASSLNENLKMTLLEFLF